MSFTRKADDSTIDLYEYRDILYYSKFKYRVKVHLFRVGYVWSVGHADLVESTLAKSINYLPSKLRNKDIFRDVDGICSFVNWKSSLTKEDRKNCRIRLESDFFSVFSNDIDFIKSVKNHRFHSRTPVIVTEAKILSSPGVKYFARQPKYQYRIYMKWHQVSKEQKTKIIDFIKKYDIKPSSEMRLWLHRERYPSTYSRPSHYMEFNDESMVVQILLMFDCFGKHFRLEKRPDILQ